MAVATSGSSAAPVRSGLALFHTTRAGEIVDWNPAAERLCGIPADEAVGRSCWEVMRGLVCHRGCSIARLAREGWPVRCADLRVRMPSGVERLTVSTIVVGSGDDAVVLHPLQAPAAEEEPAAAAPAGTVPSLTPRQREIVALLADGVRPKEIALRLGLSVPTVRNHVHALKHRLGARSQLEAAARARALGLTNGARGE
jgi:DNA-binding CsgD family transcriptional regulator